MKARKPDLYVEAVLKMFSHSCDRADGRPGEDKYNRSELRHQGRAYQALRRAVKSAIADGGLTSVEILVAVHGAFMAVGEDGGNEPPTAVGEKWVGAAEDLRRFICEL